MKNLLRRNGGRKGMIVGKLFDNALSPFSNSVYLT